MECLLEIARGSKQNLQMPRLVKSVTCTTCTHTHTLTSRGSFFKRHLTPRGYPTGLRNDERRLDAASASSWQNRSGSNGYLERAFQSFRMFTLHPVRETVRPEAHMCVHTKSVAVYVQHSRFSTLRVCLG